MTETLYDQAAQMMRRALERDDLFDLGAKLYEKTMTALVLNGFTREQAMAILTAHGSIVTGNRS